MATLRQIEANRRNAQLSTGPMSEEGKRISRRNAVRHGLTAETVIDGLEDAEDYAAFEIAVTAGYDPQSAVERELVLRLASLLWRLRRANIIESGLFAMKGRNPFRYEEGRQAHRSHPSVVAEAFRDLSSTENRISNPAVQHPTDGTVNFAETFVHLCRSRSHPLDRLSRYEARLWRQARQVILTLRDSNWRKPWLRGLPC